ncbi:MAG: hypothetical protein ACP5PP_00460 [Fervidobacterium sp.]
MRKNLYITTLVFLLFVTTLTFSEFYLNVSTVNIGQENYMVYEFGPEFTVGPVTLGVSLTTYASDLTTGNFYFGTPGVSQSTNIVDGLNITALGLDLGTFWFRYGNMKQITYGMGFVFNGYYLPNTKVIDGGIRIGNLNASVHVPYELKQLSTFSFGPSDTLYAANISTKLLVFDLSAFGGMELSENSKLQNIAGVSLTMPALGFSIGAEADVQMWRDSTLGYGGFAGIFGDFGMFQLVAGPYYSSNGFAAWLIGKNYAELRDSIDPGNYSMQMGYIAKASLTFEPYGKILLGLKGDFDGNLTLSGEGMVNIPAVAGTNGLVLYGYLFDDTPFSSGNILDNDTVARLTIAYPVFGNFYAGIKYIWNGTEFAQTAFVGGNSNF